MNKLDLLFTKDGLQYQISKGKNVAEDQLFQREDGAEEDFIDAQLSEVLKKEKYSQITVVSAINHFTMMPESFTEHELGYDLIAYNAPVKPADEELMLSVNKKFGVQFYYTLPKAFYKLIKYQNTPCFFNFSGEKFLNQLQPKNRKEIHINLYKDQCEFFAIDHKKIILYNNLDVNSEVDFLYFVMFTLSKIGFGTTDTHFFVYGETTENETFISELKKFVKHLKISFDNLHKRHFILN